MTSMKQAVQWQIIQFDIQDGQANPNVDCGIRMHFTAPSGREISRDAFWDGGDRFAVRFAPTEVGVWSYRYEGTDHAPGSLECHPYKGSLPLYTHGFLKVGPQGKHLCHQDNTPFFWLGDTHWHFAIRESFDTSNDPRYESQFKAIVDKRVEQGFNVYQCNFHSEIKPYPGCPAYFVKENGEWTPNIEFFQNNLDKKMDYLAEKGFTIAAGLSWCFSIMQDGAVDFYKMTVRYLTARYGAHPIIWTLAGEAGGYSDAIRPKMLDGWGEVAREIDRLNTYHHLMTVHYTNERPFATYMSEEPWFDFTLNQAGHGDYPIDSRHFRAHRKAVPNKPFIESESLYENVLTLESMGRRRATPAMLRRVAYLAVQNGASGYTYGAQGMWHIQWDEPEPGNEGLGFGSFDPWYKAIDFPGAWQMKIMKDFYESIGWSDLKPLDPDLYAAGTKGAFVLTFSAEDLQALFMPSVTANDDLSKLVAYYSETNRFQIGYKTLPWSSYRARWFLPETGEYQAIDETIQPEKGIWFAPVKPFAGDAILLLEALA